MPFSQVVQIFKINFTRLLALMILLLLVVSQISIAHPTQAANAPDLSQYPLFFKRSGALAAPVAQIVMVGDTSMARGVDSYIRQQGGNYDAPLKDVQGWLHTADFVSGNSEGVIAADGVGKVRFGDKRLRSQPDAAPALYRAGFRIMTLANNHTFDYGVDGLKATYQNLTQAGIIPIGAGENKTAAQSPTVTTINGIKVVWLAYTYIPDPPEFDRDQNENDWTRSWIIHWPTHDNLTQQIQAAKKLGDLVIVQLHWGNEYHLCPEDWQIKTAHDAIDAGAALVISHHPHVVQPIESYHGGFIAYSLGNFLFDQLRKPGLALWIRLDSAGVMDVHGLFLVPGVQPVWETPDQAKDALNSLCKIR
jgi:poly-gamma-glutamate synthesis protein (capsule biosynthesis protein)